MISSPFYDEFYYSHDCGRPYQRDDVWLRFFDQIAKQILEQFEPKTVLDAGCALGFLVEGFRSRGVEAFGIDVSDYAIRNVHPEIRPYCWVGSIVEPFPQKYDLITCIEVLEHLPGQEAEKAIENLCAHANEVVFSSTPFDYKETTHFNVHEPDYWAEQFARHGFFRDMDANLSCITSWAVRFVRTQRTIVGLVRGYERNSWQLRKENSDLRQSAIETRETLKQQDEHVRMCDDQVAEKEQAVQAMAARIAEKEEAVRALTGQVAEKEQIMRDLTARIAEKEEAAQALSMRMQVKEYELAEVSRSLSEVSRSKAWRFVMLLRRVRVSLLPPGSWRTRIARKLAFFVFYPLLIHRTYRMKRDSALIQNSRLFDREWYLQQNPQVALLEMDPMRHYVRVGGFEGRDPGPGFASKWYLDTYQDVRAAGINPLVHYLKCGRKEGRATGPTGPTQAAGQKQAAILFLSGCPGDAQRYRCVHQAEQFAFRGYSCDLAIYGQIDLLQSLKHYRCFVLHRVPHGPDIELFTNRAKALGKVVLFDTDDLVFDPDAAKNIAAIRIMSEEERMLFFEGLQRYRKTLLGCDGVSVTTSQLVDEVTALNKPVCLMPNVVSAEMVQLSQRALSMKRKSTRGRLIVAYLSGTRTHNSDFLEAADALLWALEKYPHVRFHVVGYLDLDDRFREYANRIQHTPLQPWQKLPEILRNIDISLAPLERDNRFTESKSCIKYLEAGLVKVPTVASKRKDFVRVIRDGINGLLAETPEEWKAALQRLIESESLRKTIAENAYEDVRNHHTSIVAASQSERAFMELIAATGHARNQSLTINWVLRAPIASTGGGYRTIFRLANYLGERGHKIRLYVEPIAHLAGMSEEAIVEFTKRNFGPLAADVFVGHDNILPADATFATNWPTAYTVANHNASIQKFYFVQDYEPEFYELQDPLYESAKTTYYLPLQAITIGHYLPERLKELNGRVAEVIPFGIDSDVFQMTRKPEERAGKTRVLFFARPGLKRRGYDIGLKALKIAKQRNPGLEIAFFGAETRELGDVGFEFVNLGVISPTQLATEMNRSHIMLCLSLSNISWVPHEGMACGLAVVEADVPSVRHMVDTKAICLAPPTPEDLAAAIVRLDDDQELRLKVANAAIECMKTHRWADTCRRLEGILLERCIL